MRLHGLGIHYVKIALAILFILLGTGLLTKEAFLKFNANTSEIDVEEMEHDRTNIREKVEEGRNERERPSQQHNTRDTHVCLEIGSFQKKCTLTGDGANERKGTSEDHVSVEMETEEGDGTENPAAAKKKKKNKRRNEIEIKTDSERRLSGGIRRKHDSSMSDHSKKNAENENREEEKQSLKHTLSWVVEHHNPIIGDYTFVIIALVTGMGNNCCLVSLNILFTKENKNRKGKKKMYQSSINQSLSLLLALSLLLFPLLKTG